METFSVYEDIAARTNGEIFVGVVGPVRTGKSTFIKRFMKELVLPNVEGEKSKRYTDELPQSAAGKTIMTTEPKFVPEEGAQIIAGTASAKVRLIDCVGFPVEGSTGFEEDGGPRLVKTPWNENPVPFQQAAEEGTLRVIRDHSTIGILMTTDGSVTGIPREAYLDGEKQALEELKNSRKPFVIVLNSANPEEAEDLRAEMEKDYCAPVVCLNAEKAGKKQLAGVLEKVLYEFPVLSIDIDLPDWMRVLDATSPLISEVLSGIREVAPRINKMKDCELLSGMYTESERLNPPASVKVEAATGRAYVKVDAKEGTFYKVLGEQCGVDIKDDFALMNYMYGLKDAKKLYERVGQAFSDAKEFGYGIVPPESDEMCLSEPKVVKKSRRVGVNLHADAPSYHIIRVDVSGEVSPALGGEEQSAAFAKQISENMQSEPESAWNTNMFGRTLKDMLGEELYIKNRSMGDNVRKKMRKTVTRIVNEGKGGVICILL